MLTPRKSSPARALATPKKPLRKNVGEKALQTMRAFRVDDNIPKSPSARFTSLFFAGDDEDMEGMAKYETPLKPRARINSRTSVMRTPTVFRPVTTQAQASPRQLHARPSPFTIKSTPVYPKKGWIPPVRITVPQRHNYHIIGSMTVGGQTRYVIGFRNGQEVWKSAEEVSRRSVNRYIRRQAESFGWRR